MNITRESKIAWEKDEIKNPRLSIKGLVSSELSLEDAEYLIIEGIRKSFSDLKEAIQVNQFNDVKIIMPSLQMVSVDKLDTIDFGIVIIEPEEEPVDDYPGVEWKHPSEMWEEFSRLEVVDEVKVNEVIDTQLAEDELDIIRKSIQK